MSTTIEKSPIGEQDISHWDGTSTTTFSRETSAGYDITMLKTGAVVDVLVSYGGGVNYTLDAISAAMSAIGATNKVGLVLRPGTWDIDDDVTITSNICLVIPPGCKFTVAAGKTATIQGPVVAGPYQWIYGTGTATISTYPQDQVWWGNTQRTDFAKMNFALGTDANGDIYYRASGVLTRLAKGTAGQVLAMNSGATAPEWATWAEMRNVGLAASVASKALTVALKGADGNDPSATNPVYISFRSATATTGTPIVRSVSAALSVTLSSGSSLGFAGDETGRIYVWAIDNAGTVELALSRTADIFPESNLVSTTAEGGAGAADSASVMYSTTARTNVACRCIGYIEIKSDATAGVWGTSPAKIQVMGPGVKRTGDIVQVRKTLLTSEIDIVNKMIPLDNTKPQIGEGEEIISVNITPTSVLNEIKIDAVVNASVSSTTDLTILALFKDSGPDAIAASVIGHGSVNSVHGTLSYSSTGFASASTDFKLRAGVNSANSLFINQNYDGSSLLGGVLTGSMTVTEIMA